MYIRIYPLPLPLTMISCFLVLRDIKIKTIFYDSLIKLAAASRNVAFKAAKIVLALAGQTEILTR